MSKRPSLAESMKSVADEPRRRLGKKLILVPLDPEMHLKLRHRALDEGRMVEAFVQAAIAAYLSAFPDARGPCLVSEDVFVPACLGLTQELVTHLRPALHSSLPSQELRRRWDHRVLKQISQACPQASSVDEKIFSLP